MKLIITPENLRFLKGKEETISIPAASIMEVSYGQDVHRQIGAAIGLALVCLGIGALMAPSRN